jgi:hypothetical protein
MFRLISNIERCFGSYIVSSLRVGSLSHRCLPQPDRQLFYVVEADTDLVNMTSPNGAERI